jgi:hypothetical protein
MCQGHVQVLWKFPELQQFGPEFGVSESENPLFRFIDRIFAALAEFKYGSVFVGATRIKDQPADLVQQSDHEPGFVLENLAAEGQRPRDDAARDTVEPETFHVHPLPRNSPEGARNRCREH